MFNVLTNTTQLISYPYSQILIKLAEAKEAGTTVNKSDIITIGDIEQAEEFIEQAIVLRIIEESTSTL